MPPGCGHHTRPSVLSWNLASARPNQNRQKRLELHLCSPAAQSKLCMKQKLVPLVRQSLTRTANMHLRKKIRKLTILSCKNGSLDSDHPLKESSHNTRTCYIVKHFPTGSINPQPSGTSPVPKPMQLHLVEAQALPGGFTTVR